MFGFGYFLNKTLYSNGTNIRGQALVVMKKKEVEGMGGVCACQDTR